MAAAKKKIQASEVVVGNRTLEGVLIDLAEQIKANDARFAARVELAVERSARAEELSAQAAARSAQNEELVRIALNTIAAVSQDLRAMTAELRASNQQHDERIRALEKAVAAE
ncbi:MAG: hypothetical protein ABJE95_36675 [Byssovorax sp.]